LDTTRIGAMPALEHEALIVRHAVPADVPALNEAIATIDEETECLGLPGEYLRRWAPGFAERLAAMNEKGTGVYFLVEHGGAVVGFLRALAGGGQRTRGGRGGSTCGSTRKTRAALRSTRSAASWSKAASSTAPAPTASGATISS